MRIDQAKLRAFSVVFSILIIALFQYNLYRKYQFISVCQSQQARLDAVEADLDRMQK